MKIHSVKIDARRTSVRTVHPLKPSEVEVRLAQIARQQAGLIQDGQAVAAGISMHQVRRRIQSGYLVRIYPRVSRLASFPESWQQKQRALCMWAGEGWVASGSAAAALWKLEGAGPLRLEISGAGRISRVPSGVIVHERCIFIPGDLTRKSGIPTTSPARTVIDLAAIVERGHLERAFESALR